MSTTIIGKPFTRADGRAKVTGAAKYAAEFNQPGQAYAVIVSGTVGLGRVKSIDDGPVLDMPGVLAVITHRSAPRLAYGAHKGSIDPAVGERLHVLQDDQVRFHGQPIALVVAETLDQAERGATALRITYAASVPVVDPTDPRARTVIPGAGAKSIAHNPADRARGDADTAWALRP